MADGLANLDEIKQAGLARLVRDCEGAVVVAMRQYVYVNGRHHLPRTDFAWCKLRRVSMYCPLAGARLILCVIGVDASAATATPRKPKHKIATSL
jgi:hypothetical protein